MDQSKGYMYLLILLGIGAIAFLFVIKYVDFEKEPKDGEPSGSKGAQVKEVQLPKKR